MNTIYDKAEHGRLVSAYSEKETARAECVKKMHDMHDAGESKAWDGPQHFEYQQLKCKADFLQMEMSDIKAKIDQFESIKPVEQKAKKERIERSAFERWCRNGLNGLEDWEIKANNEALAEVDDSEAPGARKFMLDWDKRFFNVLAPGSGGTGDVGQEQVQPGLVHGMLDYGGAQAVVTTVRTSHGNDLKYIVSDQTGATAVAVGETSAQYVTEQTEQDLTQLAERTFGAKLFNTKFTDVSRFMSEDVSFDVGAFVRGELMRRMGRLIEAQLMTGTGTNPQIWGLITRAQEFTTKTTVGKFKWQDLIDLMHDVDPGWLMGERGLYGYESRPGRRGFLTSWKFKSVIAKMSDDENRPVVLPNLQAGMPDMVYGYPVYISQNFTDTAEANNARPIIFGNFGYHVFRMAGRGLQVEQHFDSQTAMSNTWRFMGRLRCDADTIGTLSSNRTGAYKIAKIRAS